jgi:hypothetical protein
MPKCKSCEAEIVWVESEDGRRHPLNDRVLTVAIPVGDNPLVVRFVTARSSHFATCPQADQHRGGPCGPRRERKRAKAGRQCAICHEFVGDNQPDSIHLGRDVALCNRKCKSAYRANRRP